MSPIMGVSKPSADWGVFFRRSPSVAMVGSVNKTPGGAIYLSAPSRSSREPPSQWFPERWLEKTLLARKDLGQRE
jgi:hypothetical protein